MIGVVAKCEKCAKTRIIKAESGWCQLCIAEKITWEDLLTDWTMTIDLQSEIVRGNFLPDSKVGTGTIWIEHQPLV